MRLICGDCIREMQALKDNSIDMVLTDLPYGTTRNKWDHTISLPDFWQEINRVTRDDACIALWAQEPYTTQLILSNADMFRYKWIVEKTNATGFLNTRKMPLKSYEELLIFYKKLPTYNPQKTTGHTRKVSTAEHNRNNKGTTTYCDFKKPTYDSTERFPRDIVTFSWDKQTASFHPTQKPVAALEYFIRTYTNEGDTVLDATMGSGSTGVACANTNREFVGIEIDETYFLIAQKRIADAKLH